MKAVLMSIRPPHTCNILNYIKLWEIRKKFPHNYVGWVYIYCTKDNKNGLHWNTHKWVCVNNNTEVLKEICFNGKVLARFWCDRVEEITPSNLDNYAKDSCLSIRELENYLWSNICCGKAIHITQLEIFDKPMDIRDFVATKYGKPIWKPVSRPPQSWQYISI